MIDYLSQQSGTRATEEQFIVDAVFSGDFEVFGRRLGYAFGGQFRQTNFATDPLNRFSDPEAYPCAIDGDRSCLDDPNDTNFPVGAFTFLGQYPDARLSQDVYALFAEAQMEVFDGFELTGAVRFEDYGGLVGSTVNPKLSARSGHRRGSRGGGDQRARWQLQGDRHRGQSRARARNRADL